MADPGPVIAGLRCRCGTCGEGKLFARYLVFKDTCDVCGQDFSVADTADGPAFFAGFATLILLAPFYFMLPMLELPLWQTILGYLLIIAATFGLCLAMLPPLKGMLFNLQIRHRAEEAKFEDLGSP
ncbi:MAG: DUF983 domain-containing protein [Pseudomonadota bacterium]